MDEIGFAERLAYVRWLRNRGRVVPETDAELAEFLGVGVKWLGKWKVRAKAPEGRTEAVAVEKALAPMGVTLEWLYDGKGVPPEPKLWTDWRNVNITARLGITRSEPRSTAGLGTAAKAPKKRTN